VEIIYIDPNHPKIPLEQPLKRQYCTSEGEYPIKAGTQLNKVEIDVAIPAEPIDPYAVIVAIIDQLPANGKDEVLLGCALSIVSQRPLSQLRLRILLY
jgi:hypothetical protein